MFENIIRKQLNADEQENTGSAPAEEVSTAITTAPVGEETAEVKQEEMVKTAHD